MKILVFGMPRTGSTIIQKFLGTYYRIDNYNEPYTGDVNQKELGDPYQWTANLSDGIIKVLSVNLDYIDFKKLINTANFDFVILTTRKNLTDSCVSLYYAQLLNQYHYTQLPDHSMLTTFICPIEDHVTAWIRQYKQYLLEVQFLKDTNTLYYEIDYDDYLNNVPLKINGKEIVTVNIKSHLKATVHTNFDYKTLCLNYHEIEKLIHESIS
jgi:hypothetical protein